jgi:AcrR family transcriptional regulator
VAPPPSQENGTAEEIERAALEVFYRKGYHGASIRLIASTANIGLATLFYHYSSKSVILEQILNRAADQMQSDLDAATEGARGPRDRLSRAVRALVIAHCERQSQSFVAQSELRSVTGPAEQEIRRKRRRVQAVFDRAVLDGVEAGQFTCEYPRESARAIVSMGTQVAVWYRAGRGMTPDEVADIYVDMALRLVGARGRPGATKGATRRAGIKRVAPASG